MYLRIKNNNIIYPYTFQNLRKDEYNVSFPKHLSDSLLKNWGVYKVYPSPKPTDYTKRVEEGTPQLIDGIYKQNWIETPATEEEIKLKIENRWEMVREIRNKLLADSDWTVLSDSPVGSSLDEWKVYRQSLRDITKEPNPFEIIWPTPPQ